MTFLASIACPGIWSVLVCWMHAKKLNVKQWLYEGKKMFKMADDSKGLKAERKYFENKSITAVY